MLNTKVFEKIACGLFVLSAPDGQKQNGCIINTVMQATASPACITFAVNKLNYTCDLLAQQDRFNISVLDESAPFEVFQRYGFQSGRDTDKLAGAAVRNAENGVFYLPDHTAAYLSGEILSRTDLTTHTLYVARVTAGEVLSDLAPMTYGFYHANVKPKPKKTAVKGWRCKICGYIYKGETLPADFICPLCKHGAEDFEPIG